MNDKYRRYPRYQETKTCYYCKETKHWSKFVMGMDGHARIRCTECHREILREAAVGGSTLSEKQKKKVAKVFDFIEKKSRSES